MLRVAGLVAVAALAWLATAPETRSAEEPCTCAVARETNGWCRRHDIGYVGGVKVASSWLYAFIDAHGHKLDLSTFNCPSCQKAIATSGFCDIHHVGFVDKMAYFSLLTYELGKAKPRHDAEITCATCRKNAESHGWCTRHSVGMVGPFAISDRHEFDRAVSALEIFIIANEASVRCDDCAGAILTDSECPVCRITYKDGKVVSRGPQAPAAAGVHR